MIRATVVTAVYFDVCEHTTDGDYEWALYWPDEEGDQPFGYIGYQEHCDRVAFEASDEREGGWTFHLNEIAELAGLIRLFERKRGYRHG